VVILVDLPPSLHAKDKSLRGFFRQQLKARVRGSLAPRVYRVVAIFYGPFYDAKGAPLDNAPDGDNLYKVFADELAKLMRWPRNNDKWLQCRFSVERVQSSRAHARIEIT
jgi:hypothetical protein